MQPSSANPATSNTKNAQRFQNARKKDGKIILKTVDTESAIDLVKLQILKNVSFLVNNYKGGLSYYPRKGVFLTKKGELELVSILRRYGLECMHRLQQRRITEFIPENRKSRERVKYWLGKNKELPRKRHTYEIDIFSWKDSHWGALAIEQKSQRCSPKTLCVSDSLRLYSGKAELREGASDLLLQCQGAECLGNAFAAANYLNARVVPVGVVDYDIRVFGTPANWAYHEGVFFVKKTHFEEFLEEFLEKRGWVRELASKTTGFCQ